MPFSHLNGHRNAGQRFVDLYYDAIVTKRLGELVQLYQPDATLVHAGHTLQGLDQIEQFYRMFLTDLRRYDLTKTDPLEQTERTAAFEVIVIRSDLALQLINNIVLESGRAVNHLMLTL